MNEKAQKVWAVAKKFCLTECVETFIYDLEAFAETVDCDDEWLVLEAIYEELRKAP